MNQADEQLIARMKRLEAQNRVWKLGGLAVLLAIGLSLAAGVRAQQTQQDQQTPAKTNGALDFVLRDAAGDKMGEWVVSDGHITVTSIEHVPFVTVVPGPGPMARPIPPAVITPLPTEPPPSRNGQAPAMPIEAQVVQLRNAAAEVLGGWTVKTGAILECRDTAGKLIWSTPMKAIDQSAFN